MNDTSSAVSGKARAVCSALSEDLQGSFQRKKKPVGKGSNSSSTHWWWPMMWALPVTSVSAPSNSPTFTACVTFTSNVLPTMLPFT